MAINYTELRNRFKAWQKKEPIIILSFYGVILLAILIVALSGDCACADNANLQGRNAKESGFPFTTENAILSIIGEAENQGYEGMLAVAGAIRNRGKLNGVYGLKSPRIVKHLYSQQTYELAQKAWFASFYQDITNGGTHWENINAFGKPYWVKGMVETFRHKNHVFYKEKGT